jgi:hypothetical protein
MGQFRNALEVCGLADLGHKGSRYTWNNGQTGSGFIKERLDRALANKERCVMHNSVEVQVLAARTSDHKPILVIGGTQTDVYSSYRKGFKFEAKW